MDPEQGRGEKVDRRADLFAMGAILWELVTGLRFWEGKEELEILFSLYQNQLPSLAVEGLDPALLAICSRAMASQRDQRYESAEQFRAALLRYMAAIGEQVSAVDLGRRVQELFAEEKETLGRLIVERLSPAGRRPEALATSLTPPPVSGPRAAMGSMTQTESGLSAPTQMDMVHRRRRAVTVGGGAVAVGILGLLLSLRYLAPADDGARTASLSAAPSASVLPGVVPAASTSAAPVISASAAPDPPASARATPEPTRSGKGKSSTNPGASARPPAGPVRTAGGAPTSPPLFLP
jgi:serine/threonine-protein kinase